MFILTGERRLSQALKERLVLGDSFKSKIPRPVATISSGKVLSQHDKNDNNNNDDNSYYYDNTNNNIHNTHDDNNNNVYNTQYIIDLNNNNNSNNKIDYNGNIVDNNNNKLDYRISRSNNKDIYMQATDLNNNNNNDFQTVTAYSVLKKYQDQRQQNPKQSQQQHQYPAQQIQQKSQQKRQLQPEGTVTPIAREKSRIPLRDTSFNAKNNINNDSINNNNNATVGSLSNKLNNTKNHVKQNYRTTTTGVQGSSRKTILRGDGGVGTLKGGDSITASRRRPFFNVRFDDVTTTERKFVRSSIRRSRKVKTTKGSSSATNNGTNASSNNVFTKHATRFKSSLPYGDKYKEKKSVAATGPSSLPLTKKSKLDSNINNDNDGDNSKSKSSTRKFTPKVIWGDF